MDLPGYRSGPRGKTLTGIAPPFVGPYRASVPYPRQGKKYLSAELQDLLKPHGTHVPRDVKVRGQNIKA